MTQEKQNDAIEALEDLYSDCEKEYGVIMDGSPLAKRYKTIRTELERAQRMVKYGEWLPIECMPKEGLFLVCQDFGDDFSVPTVINAKLYWDERPDTPKHLRFDHFTHYMPLPDAPKEGE